ncbi:subunit gamma of coatomer complex [Hamiltosporidium magnivora]|uniref:Subunit gamma of coatomer complex n=1 Tax=Hamiltosporidium magnivora TaxID=148818 RepID=A0A4Q9LKU8_9MICR|nr:subunit gamma of coatomer complex [Hamiltosporidium magnivora]
MTEISSEKDLLKQFQTTFAAQTPTTRKYVRALNALANFVSSHSLSPDSLKSIYLYILRIFTSKDVYLRHVVYSVLPMIIKKTPDSYFGISVVSKDLGTIKQDNLKANSLSTLFMMIPPVMLNDFEKFVLQALLSNSIQRKSTAIRILYRILTDSNIEKQNSHILVKKWTLNHNFFTDKQITNYHSLALLYELKSSDINSLLVLLKENKDRRGIPAFFIIRLSTHLYKKNIKLCSEILKKYISCKEEMYALEAIRSILTFQNDDILQFLPAIVSTLRSFLRSNRKIIKFAGLRVLQDLTLKGTESSSENLYLETENYVEESHKFKKESKKTSFVQNSFISAISQANKEIEDMISDSNKTTSLLAITILLKTGNEETIDRLISLIPEFIGTLPDSFKIILISALERMTLKYKEKGKEFLEFANKALTEKGTLKFKRHLIQVIERVIESYRNEDVNVNIYNEFTENVLNILCSYLEDSQYYELSLDILYILSKFSIQSKNYMHVLNRLILDNSWVRGGALMAMFRMGFVNKNIVVTACYDEDEYIKNVSRFLYGLLEIKEIKRKNEMFSYEELGSLKESVLDVMGVEVDEKKEEIQVEKDFLIKKSEEIVLVDNSDFFVSVEKLIYADFFSFKFSVQSNLEGVNVLNGVIQLLMKGEKNIYEADLGNIGFMEKKNVEIKIFKSSEEIGDQIIFNGVLCYDLCVDDDFNDLETESLQFIPLFINYLDYFRNELPCKELKENKKMNLCLEVHDLMEGREKVLNLLNLRVEDQNIENTKVEMSLCGVHVNEEDSVWINVLLENKGKVYCELNISGNTKEIVDRICRIIE